MTSGAQDDLRALGERGPGQHRPLTPEAFVALVVVGLSAVRIYLPLEVTLGVAIAAAALPVSIRYVREYKWVLAIVVITVLAGVSGALLTLHAASTQATSTGLLATQTLRMFGIAVVLPAVLWARHLAGTQAVILSFGAGSLLSLAEVGLNFNNLWKFSLSLPITLILLSLPWVFGRRGPQFVAAAVLAAVSAFADSRSATGFLLVAAALTFTRFPESGRSGTASRRWIVLVRIVAVGAAGYFALQAAILEGVLGQAVQERSIAQIESAGSLVAGGRPEMGASLALISGNPWGIGAGVQPSPSQVLLAKEGMSNLGYDPNNGYVENYMFGGAFEVHSLLGDLWIMFGLVGVALAIAMLAAVLRGVATGIAAGTAATVTAYLAVRFIWDLAFSPWLSSLYLLPLTIAVCVASRSEDSRPARIVETWAERRRRVTQRQR